MSRGNLEGVTNDLKLTVLADGIMTPYQVKNAQKAAIIEKEQIKDPLSELDALWKMKK